MNFITIILLTIIGFLWFLNNIIMKKITKNIIHKDDNQNNLINFIKKINYKFILAYILDKLTTVGFNYILVNNPISLCQLVSNTTNFILTYYWTKPKSNSNNRNDIKGIILIIIGVILINI